jgi:hypothetical protein
MLEEIGVDVNRPGTFGLRRERPHRTASQPDAWFRPDGEASGERPPRADEKAARHAAATTATETHGCDSSYAASAATTAS